jgi:acetoin utilization deacetylase AcuC-like enzyme
MPVVWSDRHRLHDPGGEVWVGVRTPGTEVPERAERIRETLEGAGARFVEAADQPDEAVLAVHDAALVDHLATAWAEWETSGLTEDPGQDRVVPYLFPHHGFVGAGEGRSPTAISARAGLFAYDTMTLIGPGTWEAARAAMDCAVTAAELVLDGAPAAYALCRPPGHHVTRTAFGGSCYLNNTAAAAAHMHERTGLGTIAVIDIDAHHGNGTQSIFWNEPELLTGSVHVDPGAGWFPHYIGYADEAEGVNRNIPVPPGAGDEAWLAAVTALAQWARDADYMVVALGVDAAGGDPESPLEVTAEGFRKAGRILGGMGLPTVVVQEGGYDLDQIGRLVLEVLAGIEEGARG